MKKCKKCNTVQNDSRSVCVECGAVLGRPMTEDEEYEVKVSLGEKLDDLAEQSDDFYVPIKDRIIGVLCIIGGIASLILTILSNKADISNAARSGFISIIFLIFACIMLLLPKFIWTISTLRYRIFYDWDTSPSPFFLTIEKVTAYIMFGIGIFEMIYGYFLFF
ncbi:MAG: hypothetical protein E7665_02650 [Ruminococcaceae bacterium]|nr:hypothetical protein [Oscillospiraceae bacterium]